jgi:heptaprenylglyceryl phosphate synthase
VEILAYLKHLKETGKKAFAVLIDPDDTDAEQVTVLAKKCNAAQVDLVLFGGSPAIWIIAFRLLNRYRIFLWFYFPAAQHS